MAKFFQLAVTILMVIVPALSEDAQEAAAIDDALEESGWTDFWIIRLALNLLGYASVIVPAWLIIRYVRSSGYLERGGEENGMMDWVVNLQKKFLATCKSHDISETTEHSAN